MKNDVGLNGIEFVEFASPKPERLHNLFQEFGFSRTKHHKNRAIDYYTQNDIHFLVNKENHTLASSFKELHGPSICSMGWRVADAAKALKVVKERGAKVCEKPDYQDEKGRPLPAIYGIGESLIYFVEDTKSSAFYKRIGFEDLTKPDKVADKGFLLIDHLTNNVPKGTMKDWSNFYKNIFGFEEVRYFDIRGAKTGLTSFALKSPCEKFCIPINEGTEEKSQINEYLREYRGPGVQHLALLTSDIVSSLKKMRGTSVGMLDIDNEYYNEVFDRVPNVTENHKDLQDLNILVDGDDEGYLLQIFTKNIIGPIFIEIIQRKNHHSFGEGNFGALFRAIERDQQKRGVL